VIGDGLVGDFAAPYVAQPSRDRRRELQEIERCPADSRLPPLNPRPCRPWFPFPGARRLATSPSISSA